jgi:hypothetical protein
MRGRTGCRSDRQSARLGPHGPARIWPIYRHIPTGPVTTRNSTGTATPPYVAIHPSFYRKRHFMIAQERNRYRYMPHIFSGYTSEDGGGGGIDPVDTQAVGEALQESYAD